MTGDCFSLLPSSVRKMTLRSCPRIREHNFCLVGDRCPLLEELCLSKTRVTSHDIKHIAARCADHSAAGIGQGGLQGSATGKRCEMDRLRPVSPFRHRDTAAVW